MDVFFSRALKRLGTGFSLISSEDSKMSGKRAFKLYLAPMLDVTTPHFRRLVYIVSPRTVLFTEMVVADTVLHMEKGRLAEKIERCQGSTVLQIGGSDADKIAQAVLVLKNTLGYKDFNLNCGCPSARVKKGCFGAVLMLMPETVSHIINTVEDACGVVLSLKIRLGVDENDSYEFVRSFIKSITESTRCDTFFVHARKCLLKGLSPSGNRTVPPLRYDYVHRLKADFPDKRFILNGGISCPEQLLEKGNLDGFMIGREAVKDVFIFNKMMSFLAQLQGKAELVDVTKTMDASNGDIVGQEKMDLIKENTDTRVPRFQEDFQENIYALIDTYLSFYNNQDIIRGLHVLPLMNLMRGKQNSRKYRQKISSLSSQKCTFQLFSEQIRDYML